MLRRRLESYPPLGAPVRRRCGLMGLTLPSTTADDVRNMVTQLARHLATKRSFAHLRKRSYDEDEPPPGTDGPPGR